MDTDRMGAPRTPRCILCRNYRCKQIFFLEIFSYLSHSGASVWCFSPYVLPQPAFEPLPPCASLPEPRPGGTVPNPLRWLRNGSDHSADAPGEALQGLGRFSRRSARVMGGSPFARVGGRPQGRRNMTQETDFIG